MKKKALLLISLAAIILPGCGGGGGGSTSSSTSTSTGSTTEPTTETPVVTGVTISPSTKQTLYVGESFEIAATVSGVGSFNQNVTWSDSKSGVVSYSEHTNKTKVTALSEGTITLTATADGDHTKSASIQIEVLEVVSITDVSISPSEKQTLYVGESVLVKASVSGTGDYNRYVTWSDNNPGIASYEAHQNSMYVKALTKGTVTLTATANGDSTKYKTLEVEVLDPVVDGVKLSITEDVILENNNSFEISATVSGKGAYDKTVTWSSSSEGVLSFGTGNSITVKALKPGQTTLTATSSSDASKSASINVTVEPDFDYSLPMVYQKVTSAEDLVLGEHYIVLTKASDTAMSPKMNSSNNKFSGIAVERDTEDESLINNVVGNNVMTVKLVQGSVAGSYAFSYSDYYLQSTGSNDIEKGKAVNESTSWVITPSEDKTEIKSVSEYDKGVVYLKHNGSGNMFSCYSTASVGMNEVQLYRYHSGKEQISFDKESIDMSTSTTKDIKINVHGFDPTSFNWVSSKPSVVDVSGSSANATLTAFGNSGEATITCTASDGTISCTATLTVNVISYVYDQLEEGKYAIVASDGHYLSPSTGKDAETFSPTDLTQYFNFVKTYAGDNEFYITNGTQYLAKNSSGYRVALSNTPTPWVVAKSGNYFQLSYSNIGTLQYDSTASNKWYIQVKGGTTVPLVGVPTFDHMDVDSSKLVKKEYNYNESFDPTGLVVNAVYTTATGEYKKDVTADIVWKSSFETSSIKGSVMLDGVSREVEVTGLTITHFDIDSISLDASSVKTEYFVDDKVDTTGLIVKATYKDGATTKEVDVDVSKCIVTPSAMAITTTEITVEFEGKTASYPVTVKDNRFIESEKLREGYLVTFTSSINREMIGDGLASEEFYSYPVGKAVFEVVKIDYPVWAFKLVEVTDSAYEGNIGKYLSRDGTKTKLVSEITDQAKFTVEFDDETNEASVIADNGVYMCMNPDSNKFNFNSSVSGYSIYIYRDKNVLPD